MFFTKKNVLLCLVAAVVTWLFMVCVSHAADVTLQWNPVAEADGYKVYYGTATRNYVTPVDATTNTQWTLEDLNGGPFYFAITAYNDYGESGYSIEVGPVYLGLPTPVLPAVAWNSINQTLSWAVVDGAAKYHVYEGPTEAAMVVVTTVTEPSYVITLDEGTHYVAVQAETEHGYKSGISTAVKITILVPPTGATVISIVE